MASNKHTAEAGDDNAASFDGPLIAGDDNAASFDGPLIAETREEDGGQGLVPIFALFNSILDKGTSGNAYAPVRLLLLIKLAFFDPMSLQQQLAEAADILTALTDVVLDFLNRTIDQSRAKPWFFCVSASTSSVLCSRTAVVVFGPLGFNINLFELLNGVQRNTTVSKGKTEFMIGCVNDVFVAPSLDVHRQQPNPHLAVERVLPLRRGLNPFDETFKAADLGIGADQHIFGFGRQQVANARLAATASRFERKVGAGSTPGAH
jgi:hypothetical protein